MLWRELRQRGYAGGYTVLTDWLRPQGEAARVAAVRRLETPPGEQAQVDWGHVRDVEIDGHVRKLWVFTFTLSYIRTMMAEVALGQELGTLSRLHEEAFRQLSAVPLEILRDRMQTVWQGTDGQGEIVWNLVFVDFERYWGFRPPLCRPYRAQTKGKVGWGSEVRVAELPGRVAGARAGCGRGSAHPAAPADLGSGQPAGAWDHARGGDSAMGGRAAGTRAARRLAALSVCRRGVAPSGAGRFCALAGERYSVSWAPVGKPVWVRQQAGRIRVRHGADCIADHPLARRKSLVVGEFVGPAGTLQPYSVATRKQCCPN